jgi:hypothetical protein
MIFDLLKRGSKNFKTGERLGFKFHWKEKHSFGTVVYEGDEIFIAFPGLYFIQTYVGMDYFAGGSGPVHRAGFEGASMELGLETY